MHEFSIIQNVIRRAVEEADKNEAKSVKSLTIQLGEMLFVSEDAAQLAFETLSKGTILEGAKLTVEQVHSHVKCPKCGYSGHADDLPSHEEFHSAGMPMLECPKCGAFLEIEGGQECTIKNIVINK